MHNNTAKSSTTKHQLAERIPEKTTVAICTAATSGRRRNRSTDRTNTEGTMLAQGKHHYHHQQKKQKLDCYSGAKKKFMAAAAQSIMMLTEKFGYSHERATSALLRELTRGDSPPSRDEIFNTMHRCGLGIDEAAKALTVSRALKKTMSEKGCSLQQAIDDLTSRLSLANLCKREVEESVSPGPISPRIRRIQPVAAPVPRSKPQPLHPMTRKSKTSSKSNKPKVKAPTAIPKSGNAGRKRLIDDISNSQVDLRDANFSSLDKSNSVSAAVNLKIAEKSKRSNDDENSGTDSTPLRAVPVRSKIGRVDDSDSCPPQSALKRARTSNAADP